MLVDQAIRAFECGYPTVDLWRGTRNADEIQSLKKSGKFPMGHAISFSEYRNTAESFGHLLLHIMAGCNVRCFSLQTYVSSLLQAMSDVGVMDALMAAGTMYADGRASEGLRAAVDGLLSVKTHDVPEYASRAKISKDEFKTAKGDVDDDKYQSRVKTYQQIDGMYYDVGVWLAFKKDYPDKAAEFVRTHRRGKDYVYDPIQMNDEGEFLI